MSTAFILVVLVATLASFADRLTLPPAFHPDDPTS